MSRRGPDSDTLAGVTFESLLPPLLQQGKAYLVVIRGRSLGRMLELGSSPVVIGRSMECEMSVDDEGASRRHARVERRGEDYVLADLGSTNGLFVENRRIAEHPLRDGDRLQLGTSTIVKFCFQDAVEESFQRELYQSATRDPLLGVFNRQYFMDGLEGEFSLSKRSGFPLSLLMVDLDRFKSINDRYGHLVGDQALKGVAFLIQQDLRKEDLLARYGGEEFIVMLPNTDGRQALAVAERMRQRVASSALPVGENPLRLSVSIGVACLENDNCDNTEALIRNADRALYLAKETGRNRSILAGTPEAAASTPKRRKAPTVPNLESLPARMRRRSSGPGDDDPEGKPN